MLRVGVLLGTRLAERRVRDREQRLRAAARQSLEAATGEHERQVQERARAIAAIEGVHSGHWWDHASAQDIRRAWSTAREYQADEPRAARAVWRIAEELRDRYGLDVREIEPGALGEQSQLAQRAALSEQELRDYDRRLRRDGAELTGMHGSADPEQRAKLDQQLREIDELRTLIAQQLAERKREPALGEALRQQRREMQDAQLRAGPVDAPSGPERYDSPERRERLAERLAALDLSASTVDAVVLADTGQAQPTEMATPATSSRRAASGASEPRRNLHRHRRRGR